MNIKIFDFSRNDENLKHALEIIHEQALQNTKLIENQTILTQQLLQSNVQEQIQKET